MISQGRIHAWLVTIVVVPALSAFSLCMSCPPAGWETRWLEPGFYDAFPTPEEAPEWKIDTTQSSNSPIIKRASKTWDENHDGAADWEIHVQANNSDHARVGILPYDGDLSHRGQEWKQKVVDRVFREFNLSGPSNQALEFDEFFEGC